jgi:hypothetical protein
MAISELVKLLNKFVLEFVGLELTKVVAEFKTDYEKPNSVTLIQVVKHETKPQIAPAIIKSKVGESSEFIQNYPQLSGRKKSSIKVNSILKPLDNMTRGNLFSSLEVKKGSPLKAAEAHNNSQSPSVSRISNRNN